MKKNKKLLLPLAVLIFIMSSCVYEDSNEHIERSIKNEILKESSGIASLEAIYILTFVHYEENIIQSDDIYIQKDAVNIDYGFSIDDNAIKVVTDGDRKKLQVRLGKGDVLAINRVSLHRPETTHEGYRPKDATTGKFIDVDGRMNSELDELKKIYGERNLQYARENIKNFFKIIAAKYDLELDFK